MKTYPSSGQLASRFYDLFSMPAGACCMEQFGDQLKVGVKIDGQITYASYTVKKEDTFQIIERKLKELVSQVKELATCEV